MTLHVMAFTFEGSKRPVSCRLAPRTSQCCIAPSGGWVGSRRLLAPAAVHRGCSSRTAATRQRMETTAARGGEEGQMHAVGVEVHAESYRSVPGLVSATAVEITTRGHTSGCLPLTLLSLSLSSPLCLSVSLWRRKCEKHVRFFGAWCDRRSPD